MFKFYTSLLIFAACSVYCNEIPVCSHKEIYYNSYLDVAMDMISKAKHYTPKCSNNPLSLNLKPVDCADVLQMGYNESGVFEIWPMHRMLAGKALNVYCDMDTDRGGWTVIQRRGDFGKQIDYFHRDWKSYKEGFGDIKEDFWLGNDNIYILTNQKVYSVRFDLKDIDQNRRYALYDKFWIDDESHKYTLHISDYSGDAGDSMTTNHNNQKFTTKDQDNDPYVVRCSTMSGGAWWNYACGDSNLNGMYLKGKELRTEGISWNTWKGNYESLEWTEIKIRPKHLKRYR